MINGKNKLNQVILSLGGNQGDVIQTFIETKQLIEKNIGLISKSSSLYKTAAWGETNQSDFLNQVILVTTNLFPIELLQECMKIEKQLGRVRTDKNRWKERIIDIDILFYNNETITLHDLEIPHPQIANRKFILIPLREISPNLVHPILKKTIKNLEKNCNDKLNVIKN
ncbi:MAG: 2-amino-4-hydroxy-6-hydroxymethyldihydropteridine diphosphokinase [Flavobacteriales bacterium CG18_big_fil_WC_8_21_14_2_50_32_9]|nr:MAG: 2-amino-4-hydroxy-6-hydroxymethyldihydropteridine diphosphokinase [Flavobacteriales bacterium CG18_big_fil_WC_8_21_14_2_50_32_9]PJC62644.1 MAG: 2-amino-4-hydroxy-6-hydroxymethyldihydropteridine diphosphokinase [Flavobacteriales bacterium CG_4_9_14_0_2_um_filter_32_27]